MNQDEIRAHLTGPVSSIIMPFNQDGSIDENGLRNFIDASIVGGSKAIILTAGDSHYYCMTPDEIARVTQVTCEHTAGRAMVVAADYFYGTQQAFEFAKYAKDVGADLYMLLPATWAQGVTSESLANHFATVGEIMPVMAVTAMFHEYSDEFAMETLRLAIQKSSNFMAIKDDRGGMFVLQMCLEFHEQCAIFAGGRKEMHLSIAPFGCDGYMSNFVTFRPELSDRYWNGVVSKDFAVSREVIRDYEIPLWRYMMAIPKGWNAGAHALLEAYGIAGRWRRPPYTAIDDEEMEKFSTFLKSRKML